MLENFFLAQLMKVSLQTIKKIKDEKNYIIIYCGNWIGDFTKL